MLLTQFLCSILFIPLISGTNNTTVAKELVKSSSKESSTVDSTKSVQPQQAVQTASGTNNTIVLEGGSSVIASSPAPPSPPMTLPKDTVINLLSLDPELANDKAAQSPSVSKVHARKGVSNGTAVTVPIKDKATLESEAPKLKSAQNVTIVKPDHNVNKPLNHTTDIEIKVNKTIHLKPKILSSEILDKMPIKASDLKIPAMLSSSKTVTVDQLAAPGSPIPKKVQQSLKSNSHPGMIMPIVITILVVPTLAVLGYMALRRGKEAWKNRHYKRMDFLLDGMYNE